MVSINTLNSAINAAKKTGSVVMKAHPDVIKHYVGVQGDEFVKLAEQKGMDVIYDKIVPYLCRKPTPILGKSAEYSLYDATAYRRAIIARLPNGGVHTRIYGRNGLNGIETIGSKGSHTCAAYETLGGQRYLLSSVTHDINGGTHIALRNKYGVVNDYIPSKVSVPVEMPGYERTEMNGITEKLLGNI